MYFNSEICHNSFVLLSNIKRIDVDMPNPVMFNPSKLSRDEQIYQLKKYGKEYMNYDFDDKEINTLMSYDEGHLNEFINTYRKIVGLLN